MGQIKTQVGVRRRAMFVVKPLVDGAEPKCFLSPAAAKKYAETDAFREWEAEECEIHFVEGKVSPQEAVLAVKAGLSEKRAKIMNNSRAFKSTFWLLSHRLRRAVA
jgi:hypothetical protein